MENRLDSIPSSMVHCGIRTYDAERRCEAAAHRVASAFRERLSGTYDVTEASMFGSRARGNQRPDSNLDLAVVPKGRRGDFHDTELDMANIAFDVPMETGVLVQALPMQDGGLADPERFSNPVLLRNIAEDGLRLRWQRRSWTKPARRWCQSGFSFPSRNRTRHPPGISGADACSKFLTCTQGGRTTFSEKVQGEVQRARDTLAPASLP